MSPLSSTPKSSPPLSAYLAELRGLIEEALQRALPVESAPPLIVEAMRYALLGGGKRLRPCLTLATAEAIAVRDGLRAPPTHPQPALVEHARLRALPNACAVELVHTYSLVHDDLPAMDDDTLRRGRPTVHVVYGDGLAVLAGDGLLTEAFALIARSPSRVVPAGAPVQPPAAQLRSIEILAAAAGAAGMVGGQAIDLAAGGRVPVPAPAQLDQAALKDMHARKTGALIRAAATMGAAAVGADEATIRRVDEFARDLGLAFQIIDDVLDVEGSAAELGKTAGKDAAAHKVTYPSLYGVERSRMLAAECVGRAIEALAASSLADSRLAEIAEWSLGRKT